MHSISKSWPQSVLSWLKLALGACSCLGLAGALDAQNNYVTPYSVTTLAGSTSPGSADGTGALANFNGPAGLALDNAGNIYVADSENHLVRRVTPGGVVTTVNDGGNPTYFDHPGAIACDKFGNIFVADYGIHAIWKISPASEVTFFSGAPSSQGGAQDGPGATARFSYPLGLATDALGNVYVGDYANHTIRKITADGTVSTFAGTAGLTGSADGVGSAARFYFPRGLAVDRAGNVFVADTGNGTIRKITASGTVSTVAGLAGHPGSVDGNGSAARFDNPMGVAIDHAGNLYVADRVNNLVRKITPAGDVSTLAGSTVGSSDGSGPAAHFNGPVGIAVDQSGTVFVADTSNNMIRQCAPITPVLGVASVAAGQDFTLFVKTDGTLWGMGNNAAGQLGDGTVANRGTPVQVATNVRTVATGNGHTVYVKNDGTLWAMGFNATGQLGDGTTTDRHTPVQVATGVVSVAAGDIHTLFLKADGTLWGMGQNSEGELGVATTSNLPTPVQIADHVASIAAGGSQSAFVGTDGSLWISSAGGFSVVATQVATVSQGNGYRMFVKTDGTLWGVGNNLKGQLGDGTTQNQSVPVQVPGTSGVIAVTAGWYYTEFVKADGTMWAMGWNFYGQLGDGTFDSHTSPVQVGEEVATVSAGHSHLMFIKLDGTLWGVGNSLSGQLGDGFGYSWRAAPVLVLGGPTIKTQPISQTVDAGTYTLFSVEANGSPLPTFQWKKNGVAIAGETRSYLILNNVQLSDSGSYSVTATNSQGSATSESATLTVLPGSVSTPIVSSKVLGDFDGDGKADLVWTNSTTGERSMWFLNGNTMSGGASLGVVPVAWVVSATADFNGDGKADIFWTNTVTGDRAIWLMNGSTMLTNTFMGTVPPDWMISGTGDFNGDGKADLVWTNTTTGDRAMWLMNGSAVLGGGYLGTVPVAWTISGVGDFDGDGKADLVWSNTATGERSMWFQNGSTTTAGATLNTVPVEWVITGVGDFNGDAKADIFLSNTTTGDRVIWFMNGSTIATNAFMGTVPVEWIVSGTGDFNGGGKKDLFWTNTTTGDRAMWLLNGTAVTGGGFMGTVPLVWKIN